MFEIDENLNVGAVGRSATGSVLERGQRMSIVRRLGARGCWSEGAIFLAAVAKEEPSAALERAALLIEQCMFTLDGWLDAEEALAHAESIAEDGEQAGATASERAFFAYITTLFGGQDQATVAYKALELADGQLGDYSSARPLLDFRRGLIIENLKGDPKTALAAYERAHIAAEINGDAHLLSYTTRHLGSLSQNAGDLDTARRYYAESLRYREETGFLIGIAPALVTLASVSSELEASYLLVEASRLVRAFGGQPVWLVQSLETRQDKRNL